MKSDIQKLLSQSDANPYTLLDELYLELDRQEIRRTRNIKEIPFEGARRGGKYSYAEWAHVIGIFQTLIYQNVNQKSGNRILDVGCGTGLLGIAAKPYVDKYVGLDVGEFEIDFCRKHFSSDTYSFHHLDVANPSYAPEQSDQLTPWPIEDSGFDLVTALSVWTHFSEKDARFYLSEVARVLRPGSRAIITMFTLDSNYRETLSIRETGKQGRFHGTNQEDWVFDQSAYGSENWFHPAWATIPENAIGITETGLKSMAEESGLALKHNHVGNWKEKPGLFFQDVLIFEKPN